MQNVLGVMLAVGVPQVPGVVRSIPLPNAFKSTLPAVGGVGQVVLASVIPLIIVGADGGLSGTVPTTKFENWLLPTVQPVEFVKEGDNGVGAPGQIDAHVGAASARGIATINSCLNIPVFFINLGQSSER
jgi:hypothetical protein